MNGALDWTRVSDDPNSAAARIHCAENFSYERMLDRMEAIYRQASGRT